MIRDSAEIALPHAAGSPSAVNTTLLALRTDASLAPMGEFEDRFRNWLERALTDGVPPSVIAFCFNLFEHVGDSGRYGIELVGTSEFAPNDPDWPCEEIWEPADRKIEIPASYCSASWSECLKKMKNLVQNSLEVGEPPLLRSVQGIGIGFVDGELELLTIPPL